MATAAPLADTASRAGLQRRFAARIRDPATQPLPEGIDPRRMRVYEELFYNNVEALLAANFPVIRRLLDDAEWHGLARGFLSAHRCQSPLFTEVAQEFVAYLTARGGTDCDDRRPYLCELAHYEWVELALSISDADQHLPPVDHNGDVWSGVPVRSPLAWPLSYRFPVHRIGPDFLPTRPDPTPTHLLVYRDREDAVRFVEINAVTQRVLGLLEAHLDWTGAQAVGRVAVELGRPDEPGVLAAGRALLEDLRERNVLLGTRPGTHTGGDLAGARP
jgi:hypothetical protein